MKIVIRSYLEMSTANHDPPKRYGGHELAGHCPYDTSEPDCAETAHLTGDCYRDPDDLRRTTPMATHQASAGAGVELSLGHASDRPNNRTCSASGRASPTTGRLPRLAPNARTPPRRCFAHSLQAIGLIAGQRDDQPMRSSPADQEVPERACCDVSMFAGGGHANRPCDIPGRARVVPSGALE